jgi:D-alanine-D-alanine ligase
VHVVVVAGGLSHERDVSLKSGSRVAYALADQGNETTVVDLDSEGLSLITSHPPDVLVNLLHGGAGEDGTAHSVLELCDVPMVGSVSSAARLAYDKVCASEVFARAGLAVPRSFVASVGLLRELGATRLLDRLAERLGLPLVVKPRASGSAFGISVVQDRGDLATALISAFRYDDVAVVQEFVAGRELAVAVVDVGEGPRCLDAVEIVTPPGELFDYEHRYTAGLVDFVVGPELPNNGRAEVERCALDAYQALGLRDYSRVDLIVDDAGTPYVLEAAVNPGMTETSLWPLAVEASGLHLGEVWNSLIRAAHGRGRER